MQVPEQVKRLGLVIGLLLTATLVGRFLLIPRDLIATDLHWSAAMERERAIPVKFAGMAVCQGCHSDVAEKKTVGFHKNLSCEGCHGPAATHADDPSTMKPGAPRDRRFCPVCHEYDPSRPTGFPQVNSTAHNPLKACVSCHDPHAPVPPTVPKECAACHGQIERTKALSRHALLPCTTCHPTPEQHRTAPRTALPSKPTAREFCGTCHGANTAAANAPVEAPRIDITTHGGRNLCWDCHYPHLPEGQP